MPVSESSTSKFVAITWDNTGAVAQTPAPGDDRGVDPWNGVEDREDAIDLTTSLGERLRTDSLMEPVPVLSLDTPLRLLPAAIEPESIWKRLLFLAIALALVVGFFVFTDRFWAPARAGRGSMKMAIWSAAAIRPAFHDRLQTD